MQYEKHNLIIISITLFLLSLPIEAVTAQEKYIDKHGIVVFEASEELFEPVKARNESVTVILDLSNGEIASLALIRGFEFSNPLMQEHFNENYIESELYPKALFQGRILNFDKEQLGQSALEYTVQGTLKVRDIDKPLRTTVRIQRVGEVISIRGRFTALPGDFDIKIPKIVANKIAKQVLVNIDFKLVSNQ